MGQKDDERCFRENYLETCRLAKFNFSDDICIYKYMCVFDATYVIWNEIPQNNVQSFKSSLKARDQEDQKQVSKIAVFSSQEKKSICAAHVHIETWVQFWKSQFWPIMYSQMCASWLAQPQKMYLIGLIRQSPNALVSGSRKSYSFFSSSLNTMLLIAEISS